MSKRAPTEPVLVMREGAAGELVGADLVVAGAVGQVGDLAGEAGEVQVVGVP